MTKIGDEVIFASESLTKFYRLPVSLSEDNFIINTARNSVSCIQVTNQKLLQTWTLVHPHSFTAPVIVLRANNKIATIMDNETIMTWDESDEDLRCARKEMVHRPIFAVIPTGTYSRDAFIVFVNGALCLLDDFYSHPESASTATPYIHMDEELIWTDGLFCLNDTMVIYLVQNKKTLRYVLRTFVAQSCQHCVQPIATRCVQRAGLTLLSWCLLHNPHQPSFLTLWSDGEIHSYSVIKGVPRFLFRLPGISAEMPAVIDTIGENHLVLTKTVVSAGKNESRLEVWDLTYYVAKAVKVLKYNLMSNAQIRAIGSSVFLSTREGVILVPVELGSSTLSSALGKSAPCLDTDGGKSFSWTPDGDIKDEEPIVVEHENSASYVFDRMTSEKFKEMIGNLPVGEIDEFCYKLSERTDITEEEVVKILQLSLEIMEEEVDEERMEEDGEEYVPRRKKYLNAIFKIPFSDMFMICHLKRLSFKETVVALTFLLEVLESQLLAGKDSEGPSDIQIVNWIELLTQSHYDDLVTSSDANVLRLLTRLRHSLSYKMEVYSELQEIGDLLSIIKKRTTLPVRSVEPKYCTDRISL